MIIITTDKLPQVTYVSISKIMYMNNLHIAYIAHRMNVLLLDQLTNESKFSFLPVKAQGDMN